MVDSVGQPSVATLSPEGLPRLERGSGLVDRLSPNESLQQTERPRDSDGVHGTTRAAPQLNSGVR